MMLLTNYKFVCLKPQSYLKNVQLKQYNKGKQFKGHFSVLQKTKFLSQKIFFSGIQHKCYFVLTQNTDLNAPCGPSGLTFLC